MLFNEAARKNKIGGKVMINIKKSGIIMTVLALYGFISFGTIAAGAEIDGTDAKISYKFRVLKDKISALAVKNPEIFDTASVSVSSKLSAAAAGATNENAVVKTVDGVTVVGNDIEKAGVKDEMNKNGYGRVKFSLDDRIRYEQNGYKTAGGNNFSRSGVVNRMRLNMKMSLGEKTSANFSAQKSSNFGDKTQNRAEDTVNHGNIVVDLDK
jgi:hypothetical protein